MLSFAGIRAVAAILVGMAMVSALPASLEFAAGSPAIAVKSTAVAWTYYATYPDYASCVAAGQANPQKRSWQCNKSSPSGAHDLYLWY
ncbi:hypothetical protein FHX44_112798 [Pseudonocardia hierapolitana]|uniref:Uncharacterized protein n=1 Tax=Pseudonocardia hierapolitana TaxID=1128676 RepID=A0A561SPV2_9PSEU|nr:hypothetical protein FHX44_112798 [Pseudonocardia hierapolitana]